MLEGTTQPQVSQPTPKRPDASVPESLLRLLRNELHELAAAYLRKERPDHTLQPTALVNEAYLRLGEQRNQFESRSHFLALAATMMRRVLVDHARAHDTEKRGGCRQRVTLSAVDAAGAAGPGTLELLELDRVLTELSAANPFQARLVELRFFAGLGVEEAADVLGVSPTTLKKEWRFVRAWLKRRLDPAV